MVTIGPQKGYVRLYSLTHPTRRIVSFLIVLNSITYYRLDCYLIFRVFLEFSKTCNKRYARKCLSEVKYDKQKCIFSVVPHFDIPQFVLLHSMSSNCSERRSISLGLKNIMIYVITFLIMTGKKYKTSYNHINSKMRKTPKPWKIIGT